LRTLISGFVSRALTKAIWALRSGETGNLSLGFGRFGLAVMLINNMTV
jgi:hypothetical protein